MKYESIVLCSDTDAGHEALQDAIQAGYEVFCQWQEEEWISMGRRGYINHIALRRALVQPEREQK